MILKKYYLLLWFMVSVALVSKANTDNLSGTLSILKPEYYPYSAIHGAVACDWVINIWDLAWDRKLADIEAGQKKDELIGPEKAPALIRIVDLFFHRPPGTVGPSAFTPTERIKSLEPSKVADLVGRMISSSDIVGVAENIIDFAKTSDAKTNVPSVSGMVAALKKFQNGEQVIDMDVRTLGDYVKGTKKLLPDAVSAFAPLTIGINRIVAFKSVTREMENVLGQNFAKVMVTAFTQNPQESKMVLLVLLWLCCGLSKEFLKVYYEVLDNYAKNLVGTSIFVGDVIPNWSLWMNSRFELGQVPMMVEKMDSETRSVEQKMMILNNPEFCEKFIYAGLIPGKYPKMSSYKKIPLWSEGKLQLLKAEGKVVFPDCMDNAIMNFICILAYNNNSKVFDLNHLNSSVRGSHLDPKLIAFFNGFHPALFKINGFGETEKILVTPNSLDEPVVHMAWADVVSNIRGVTYNKMLKDGELQPGVRMGFLIAPVDKFNIFKKLRYYPFEMGDGIGFEVESCVKNFIIVTNYLLGLNLYPEARIYDEILRPDFIKVYLPMLGRRLGIKFEPSCQLNEIDKKDFVTEILTKIYFEEEKPSQFVLATSYDHGEIRPMGTGSDMGDERLSSVSKCISGKYEVFPSLKLIKLKSLSAADILQGSWLSDVLKNGNMSSFDLLSLNVKNPDVCTNILQMIKDQKISIDKSFAKVFTKIVGLQSDYEIKTNLYGLIINLFEDEDVFSTIIQAAKAGMQDKEQKVTALKLFAKLVKKNKALTESLVAANSEYNDEDDILAQAAALELFNELVCKDTGFIEAMKAASVTMDCPYPGLRVIALTILKNLASRRYGVPDIKGILEKCKKSLWSREELGLAKDLSNFISSVPGKIDVAGD